MTDNEIIKALKCCCGKHYCETCHYKNKGDCLTVIKFDVIDLIHRQNEEKEALINGQETLQKYIAEQKAEIERLKETPKCLYAYDGETLEYCVEGICPKYKTVAELKAEAYKEFAERLKERFWDVPYETKNAHFVQVVDVGDIDNLLKELVGGSE